MKVKYNGTEPLVFTTLGIEVTSGDTVEVPDDFNHILFEKVELPKVKKEKEEKGE